MIDHRRLATAGLAALVLSLGAAALSGTPQAGGPPGGVIGAGMMAQGRMGSQSMDQRFIVMMIPHHDGAIAMADLALTRAKRPEIKELAQSIKASQTSENAQMRALYRQWYGGDVPTWTSGGAMGIGMGMGGMGMGTGIGRGTGTGTGTGMGMGMGMGCCGGMGMMGTSLAALETAADFDRAFIEQMIPHHRMGVMMASMAQNNSQQPQLRTMQQAMVKAQSQEIEQMSQWYRSWYR